jgi:hypothetical protein
MRIMRSGTVSGPGFRYASSELHLLRAVRHPGARLLINCLPG